MGLSSSINEVRYIKAAETSNYATTAGDAATVGGKTPGTSANNVLVLDAIGKVPTANLPSIPSANLPIASTTTLGGIKIGANLSIDANGVLSAAAQISYDAAHSFATNGYQKFSNGLIIQWGVYNAPANANVTITLPSTFPSAFVNVSATLSANLASLATGQSLFASPINTSRFKLVTTAAAGNVYWFAIGY